jgi:hypothetical protein
MNKLLKIQNPASFDLAESRDRIAAYHENGWRAAQQQFGYQFLAGLELHRVKESLAHGQFLKWREENLPAIPERTARRYMDFAEVLISKSATVADLTTRPLQLTNGEIPEKEKKAILEAVFEFADGKSITDLYRDLGVIRPPKSRDEIDTTKKKQLTAEEKAAAEEQEAKALKDDKLISDSTLCDHSVSARLTTADYKEIIDSSIRVANFYRALLKDKKKGKANALEVRPQKQGTKSKALRKSQKV